MTDEPVLTDSKQVGDDIIIQTQIECAEGTALLWRSLWRVSPDRRKIAHYRTELGIGTITLDLRPGPTPVGHIAAVRAFAVKQFGQEFSVDYQVADFQGDFRRVFLATREEGCEVFADEISARFWAGTPSNVRNVSLRAASSALKTDEETVIESAIAATRSARMEMQVGISLLEVAKRVRDRFEATGISVTTLEAGSIPHS